MKQVIISDYGTVDVLKVQNVPMPEPATNEILVKIKAAGINPIESKIRSGAMKQMMPVVFPYTPGSDGAGVVEKVGNSVTNFKVGDEVFGSFRNGSLSAYTIMAEDGNVVAKPANMSFETAASLPMVGTTAMDIIETGNLSEGQSILVIGATGGIGTLLVQILLNKGATVIATGREGTIPHLQQLGVQHIIDYTRVDPIENIKKYFPDGVDAVIDLVNMGEKLLTSATAVGKNGQLISVLFGPPPAAFPQKEITVHYINDRNKKEWLTQLADMVDNNKLRVTIDKTFDLDDVQKAYDTLDKKNPLGKVVVTIN